MCYTTASLGALGLLDLARTKTTSVDGWVKEVVGRLSLVLWLILVRCCVLFGARERTCLCILGRLRGRRGRALIQWWVGCKMDGRCNRSNDLCFFSEETKHSVWQGYLLNRFARTCAFITYQPFYLHLNLRPTSKECTCAHVDPSPSTSKYPGINKIAEKLSQPPSAYYGTI